MNFESATRSVLRVGDGRGFIVDGAHDRFVITAAHCLPFLPPPMSFSSLEERTFLKLLAQLGCSPDVWAECFIVDPVSISRSSGHLTVRSYLSSLRLTRHCCQKWKRSRYAQPNPAEKYGCCLSRTSGTPALRNIGEEHFGTSTWLTGYTAACPARRRLRAPEELLEWSVLLAAVPARFTPQGGPECEPG